MRHWDHFRVPRNLSSLIVVIVALLTLGTVAYHFANPALFVMAVFVGTVSCAVFGIVLWFTIGQLHDRRQERVRYERQKRGECITCGHDLRGLDGNCPRCGLPIWRPAPASR